MNRTDIHRPSEFVPADYDHVLDYSHSTESYGEIVPSIAVNCFAESRGKVKCIGEDCCVSWILTNRNVTDFARERGSSNCTVCGASFGTGSVWRHRVSGEYIFIGWVCSEKYAMLWDRSAHEIKMRNRKAAAAMVVQRKKNDEERAAFLAQHEGLEAALATDHHIVRDILASFKQYRSLTDKQIALVFKLAAEAANPRPEEVKINAPLGKVTFTGTIVKAGYVSGDFGDQLKGTIKVTTPDGIYLVYGTIPASISDEVIRHNDPMTMSADEMWELKGRTVEVTAKLTAGRDPFFAFMSRPRGRVVA